MSIQDLQSAGIISPVDIGIEGVQAYTTTPTDSTEKSQVSLKTYNERCDEVNTLSRLANEAHAEIQRLRNEVTKLLLSNDRWEKQVEELCDQNIKRRNQLAEFVEFLGDDFIDAIAQKVSAHAEINYEELAEHIDYSDLGIFIDENTLAETIANEFDVGDIADWVSIDYDDLANKISYTDLACELDYSDLAANINYEDTIDEVVREKLDELQVKNCTITFS